MRTSRLPRTIAMPLEPSAAKNGSGSEHLPSAACLPQYPRNSMNTSSDLASRPRTGAPHVDTSAASLPIYPPFRPAEGKPRRLRAPNGSGACGTILPTLGLPRRELPGQAGGDRLRDLVDVIGVLELAPERVANVEGVDHPPPVRGHLRQVDV